MFMLSIQLKKLTRMGSKGIDWFSNRN